MTTNTATKHLLTCLGAAALSIPAVQAQNPNFAPGDLVLFFQKEGDTDTVYARLGDAATTFRGTAAGADGTNQLNFLTINTQLVAAFGSGWASDPAVYAGLAAVWSSSTGTGLQTGDPARTIYVSSPRTDAGTVGTANSAGWDMTLAGNTAMTNGSSGVLSMNLALEVNYLTAVAVSPVGTSTIDDQNPISGGVQGNAFQNNFAGGVQQPGTAGSWGSFGGAGSVEFALDLYRILARGTGGSGGTAPVSGQVAGDLRVGSYEGTITVNSSGQVSFISQGAAPSSTYTTWVNTFNPPLTDANDRLSEADPDKDGVSNLMEFVLNGNPSVSGQSILPTLDASGLNFVFSFNRRADSAGEATQVFEYSTNLVDWTTKAPITIPTTPGTVGLVTVGASTGVAPNQLQAVTLTIPKNSDTKLFGRLKVVR